MTTYIFSPASLNSNTIFEWDSTADWSPRSVPNSSTAVVEFPLAGSTSQPVYYEAEIQAGESFTVSAAAFNGGELLSFGTLTVLNEMVVGKNGSFGSANIGGTSVLSAGALLNDGSIAGLGQYAMGGDLLNRGTLLGGGDNGLSLSAASFENVGVLGTIFGTGNLTVSVGAGGFANLSGGTLTGGSYLASAGQDVIFNVKGPIITLAAILEVGGSSQGELAGDLETYGAAGTSYVSLRSSLTTIASTGILGVESGTYSLSQAVTVQGAVTLEGTTTLTAPSLTVAAGATVISTGNGSLSISGPIVDNGSIVAGLGAFPISSLIVGAPVSGSGSLVVGPGAAVDFGRSSGYAGVTLELTDADSAKVVFSDNAGTLQLDAPPSFSGSIQGFTKGDSIILSGLSLSSVTGTSYANGVLTVSETGGAALSFSFLGTHSASDFSLVAVQAGVAITDTAVAATAATSAASAISAFQAGTLASGTVVTDTAANIASHLDMLQTLEASGQIGPIVMSDPDNIQIGTVSYNSLILPPTLTLTAGQVILDGGALANIAGAYSVSVTGATVQQAELLAGTAHITSIAISDSLADIGSQLDQLESLAATGQVKSIAVTDSTVPTLSLSASQYQADHVALADMTGNFDVAVTAPSTGLSLSGLSGHGTTVTFSGTAGSYSLTPTGDGIGLTVAGAATYTLRGVSALQFSDVTEIVAQAPGPASAVTTGNITEIYGAVFGREPDVGGLAFYQSYLNANPGTPLTQFAQWFLASAEYVSNPSHNYAHSSAGDAQFITDSYHNLLGRMPSAGEISYYQNVIAPFIQGLAPGSAAYAAAETQAHALALTYFSQSPEFFGDVQITASHPASAQHWLLLI